jgi:hypothetical protein
LWEKRLGLTLVCSNSVSFPPPAANAVSNILSYSASNGKPAKNEKNQVDGIGYPFETIWEEQWFKSNSITSA